MKHCITSLALGLGELARPPIIKLLLKGVATSVIAFVVLAAAAWYGLGALMALLGFEDGLFYGAGPLRDVASAIMAMLGLWLLWRVIAMAVVQFYADDVVELVEARHYPEHAKQLRDVSMAEQTSNALRSARRALLANLIAAPFALALIFTAIGPAILFGIVNAIVLGRELQDTVWHRHRQSEEAPAILSKLERIILGGAVTFALAIPFVHFLAPMFGAASAAHLVNRKLASLSDHQEVTAQ